MTRVAKTFAKVLKDNCNNYSLLELFEIDYKKIVDENGFCGEDNGFFNEQEFSRFVKEYFYIGTCNEYYDYILEDPLIMAWRAYQEDKKEAGKVILKTLAMWLEDIKEECLD